MIFAAPKVVAFCRGGTLFHTLAIRLVANFGYPGTVGYPNQKSLSFWATLPFEIKTWKWFQMFFAHPKACTFIFRLVENFTRLPKSSKVQNFRHFGSPNEQYHNISKILIAGRSGKSKVKNGGDSSTTYSAAGATNSASYTASHASNYDQYGSRYNYGNYGQYYQGYSYWFSGFVITLLFPSTHKYHITLC